MSGQTAKDPMVGGYDNMIADEEDRLVDAGKTSKGDQAKEKLASTAKAGADKLSSGATALLQQGERYLDGADLSPVRSDVERMIRQYPLPAIVTGVLAGYLLAHRGALKALAFGLGVGYLVSRTQAKGK